MCLFVVTLMECVWVDEDWIEDLIWVPSQCYRRIRCGGRLYTLYLRWRWRDPWQFYIVSGDMVSEDGPYIVDLEAGTVKRFVGVSEDGELRLEDITWKFLTDDLFEKLGIYFRDEELKEAEEKAEELFMKWVKGEIK